VIAIRNLRPMEERNKVTMEFIAERMTGFEGLNYATTDEITTGS
jgi:hypothetical protein